MLGLDAFRRKPKQFDYKPVYFDPQKEAREHRKRELLGDDAVINTEDSNKEYVAGSYIRRYGFSRGKVMSTDERSLSSEQRSRNMRRGLIALILLLIVLAYLIFS